MKQPLTLAIRLAGILLIAKLGFGQEPLRELSVHLVQANNDSPYAFVRAKFEPGEVADPWAVRFFDQRGREIPYFVWESQTWKTAREGRVDWGHRYALLNHHPGNAPEALQMRPSRLEAAKGQFPELAALLMAQEKGAKESEDSVCAALYLLRHKVPAMGKDKLTLHIYDKRQVEPKQKTLTGDQDEKRRTAAAGKLEFHGLPDKLAVHWKGSEIFRSAGFRIGDKSPGNKAGSFEADTHAATERPWSIEITEGIITKLHIRGQSRGRLDSQADWQCTYWLFPEGSYAALQGFSLENTDDYLGGGLSMSRWEMPRQPKEVHAPTWEAPWWLHETGERAFTAIHQFPDVPLAVGYANNPFDASAPGSFQVRGGEKTKGAGDGILEFDWQYELTDKRLYRLFHPRLDNDGSYDLSQITDLRETLLTGGKLTNVPTDLKGKDGNLIWPPERVQALEEAVKFVKWRPGEDWLYRQHLVGVGETADLAEEAARNILGAGIGWIDRPFQEEDLAELLVQFSLRKSAQTEPSSLQPAWMVLPANLKRADHDAARKALQGVSDPVEVAADAMQRVRAHVAAGGDPLQGTTKGGGEGWINNPVYAAVDVPVSLRFLQHFELERDAKHTRAEYREALLQWTDFSLETLGGKPLDWDKLRESYHSLWPNRIVMLVPLLLRAHRETGDEKYTRAARLLFDEMLMRQVEKNPHGYFWAWGHAPQKAEPFDVNYNIAAYDRGITDFWSEESLAVIGKERASHFIAAQARYLAFSGQFLDTLETDSMTALQSNYPGQVPFAVGQLAPLLHDDFPFYRGLAGDAIRWSAIDDGGSLQRREGRRNLYSLKIGSRGLVYWAYRIGGKSPSCSKTAREMRGRWLSTEKQESSK